MSYFLMVDVGAGTLDVLWYDSATGEHFKAVAPSPGRTLAWNIQQSSGPLAITGFEMGGVPNGAIKERARTAEVVMTASAANTLHHNPEKVRAMGIQLVSEQDAGARVAEQGYTHIVLGDVQPETIRTILTGLSLPLHLDAIAVCGQDHGMAPPGVSHIDFRHNLFKELLDPVPQPQRLLFASHQIPAQLTRLVAMAGCAGRLEVDEVYVMDSGMAAITGALQDVQLKGKDPVMVLDVATSHTVVGIFAGGQAASFLEYHTRDLTLSCLEQLMIDLADGRIGHQDVIDRGGHGAWVRQAVGFANLQAILATGPKRGLLAESRLPIMWGAPWGDNMMTGTVGLLEALRLRKGLEPIRYL